MVTVERVGLQFLIVVLIRINVNAGLPYNTIAAENALNVISQLLGKRSRGPMLIILDRSSNAREVLRTSENNLNEIDAEDEIVPFDDSIDDLKTKKFVKEILRSTGDENDPEVQKTNDKFKKALRARCSEYAKCESTCEPKKKKKKKDCKKSCKEVFDYLMLCHPPGGKGKKKTKTTTSKPKTTKKDSCESSDDCAEKKDPCASGDSCAEEPKDSCATGGTCEEPKKKPKDSCASNDSCAESKQKDSCEPDGCEKDSCAETDECTTTTKATRPPPGKGKTMPPKWRF